MSSTTTQQRRKGIAKIIRLVEHKNIAIVEVVEDPMAEDIRKESMVFFNKTKQSWMVEALEFGDLVGIELPLREGRGPDLITWALPTHAQPENVQRLEKVFGNPGNFQQESQDEPVESVVDTETFRRVTGKLRDPETQRAFEMFMDRRGLTQTEAVDVLIGTGLRKMGYLA